MVCPPLLVPLPSYPLLSRPMLLFTFWFIITLLLLPLMLTLLFWSVCWLLTLFQCCCIKYGTRLVNFPLYPSTNPVQKLLLCGPCDCVHASLLLQNGL